MIIHGDSLEKLKDVADQSVDLLCTDPPYGYSFMGKAWDKTLPDIGIFKECFRVLKPGAFAFVMSAPRSDVCARMMLMLEDAGFEIGFTPIYWTYASGFPKAMNIGKMVDKRAGAEREIIGRSNRAIAKTPSATDYNGTQTFAETAEGREASKYITAPATPEAKALDGSYGGFQPKPAVEVIIVAMKPLSEKTYVDQALKNGKGVTWLDDCRVRTTEVMKETKYPAGRAMNPGGGKRNTPEVTITPHEGGRFPANLLVSDDVLNDGKERKSAGGESKKYGDGKSFGSTKGIYHHFQDTGSYSRYFDLDAWAKTLPFLIVPKAAKSEKGADNKHPTVKPLKLISYLITLGSRPGDVVLDPFLGSGTTAVAAKMLNRECIGIEREEEYVKIAEARLNAVPEQLPLQEKK